MTNDNQKGTFCILGQWLCPNFRTNCLYQGIKQYIKFVNIKASLLVDIPRGGGELPYERGGDARRKF